MRRASAWLLFYLLPFWVSAAEPVNGKRLVSDFWRAQSPAEVQVAGEQLLASANDVGTLYQWLKAGPEYRDDVPRDYQETSRSNSAGMQFPYVVLIPESYDPARAYPVEFMLHGGVSRPAWEPGGSWWRRGYDALKNPDRIMVVPASWQDAFWWSANQAENLPAILRAVKQTYHVDSNRVYLTGVSDGGTGVWFFAFLQSTEWAAFFPYIAHPAVLRNRASGGGYALFFENLSDKPLYIVNGENDPLYPVSSVMPYIELLQQAGINHVFKAIPGGGHNTNWLPEESAAIEQFKASSVRDPLPDEVQWITFNAKEYQRNHWIVIEELAQAGQPGRLQVQRQGNHLTVRAFNVAAFTLLLNPEEINFSEVVTVELNDTEVFNDLVREDADTLLTWAARDLDSSMLFTAVLNIRLPN